MTKATSPTIILAKELAQSKPPAQEEVYRMANIIPDKGIE